MIGKIEELLRRVEEFRPKTAAEVEEFRIKVLGKKGELNALMEEFKRVAPELKREVGQRLNALKQAATERVAALRAELQESRADDAGSHRRSDPSRFGRAARVAPSDFAGEEPDRRDLLAAGLYGGRRARNRGRLARLLGTQLPARTSGARHAGHLLHREEPRHPAAHPHLARSRCARWSTSSPPIRVICPGRVFRNEAISYRAHCIFHQIEGLYIDEGRLVRRPETDRMLLLRQRDSSENRRPSGCVRRTSPSPNPRPRSTSRATSAAARAVNGLQGHGLAGDSWAAAWWTPTCLEAYGIDPKKYSGFAFGMGVERIAMLKYGVK